MNERFVTARSAFSNRRPSVLFVHERTPFCKDSEWSSEEKHALTASPLKRESSIMHFIEKETARDPDEIIEIWKRLKQVGMPVVPTMRKIDGLSLIMTDMAYDGSTFFGKYLWASRRAKKPTTEMVNYFTQIDYNEVKNKANLFTHLATQNNIKLAQDDAFEVLVHPNGLWQLIMLDLTEVEINVNEDDLPGGSLEDYNQVSLDMFLQVTGDLLKTLKK